MTKSTQLSQLWRTIKTESLWFRFGLSSAGIFSDFIPVFIPMSFFSLSTVLLDTVFGFQTFRYPFARVPRYSDGTEMICFLSEDVADPIPRVRLGLLDLFHFSQPACSVFPC